MPICGKLSLGSNPPLVCVSSSLVFGNTNPSKAVPSLYIRGPNQLMFAKNINASLGPGAILPFVCLTTYLGMCVCVFPFSGYHAHLSVKGNQEEAHHYPSLKKGNQKGPTDLPLFGLLKQRETNMRPRQKKSAAPKSQVSFSGFRNRGVPLREQGFHSPKRTPMAQHPVRVSGTAM